MSAIQQVLLSFGGSSFSGVLDSYTSNLWSCGGIKRLLGSYTSSLIRVRRSSDNAEADIGYLSDGTLDTTALAAHVGSDSAYIVTVYDQSGGGNNFNSPTTAKQPRIVNAGTYDGFIRFDGTDDVLQSVNAMPANPGLSWGGRYALRAVAGSGTTVSIFTHPAPVTGKNTMLYQQQSNSGRYASYLFEGDSTNLNVNWETATTSEVCDMHTGAKPNSETAKFNLTRNGSIQGIFSNSGSVGTSNFTSEILYMGNIDTNTQPSQMNLKWFFHYSSDNAANAAAITSAL